MGPRSTRSATSRSGTTCSCRTRSTITCGSRELPNKNIDTGASVERLAVVLQDADHAFETDLLRPLVEVAEALSGRRLGKDERDDVSLKVIGEHGRATTFLIADGVQPSNEARLPRAQDAPSCRLPRAAAGDRTRGHAGAGCTDGRAVRARVPGTRREPGLRRAGRELGGRTLRRHPEAGDDAVRDGDREGDGTERLPGDVVFKLHDTFGFPKELTSELAADAGLEIDDERFEALMEEQRERAALGQERARGGGALRGGGRGRRDRVRRVSDPRVRGKVARADRTRRREPVATEGEEVRFVLDRTPFYAESGGQVGDQGVVETPAERSR